MPRMRHSAMLASRRHICFFFFFNDTATTEIYTLSLHDALPIFRPELEVPGPHGVTTFERLQLGRRELRHGRGGAGCVLAVARSEEHTSELQSQSNLVCRLLLEKKKFSRDAWDELSARLVLNTSG